MRKKLFLILLAIFMVGLLFYTRPYSSFYVSLFIGDILRKTYFDPKTMRELNNISPSSTWSIYRDKTLQLSFQYPQGWKIDNYINNENTYVLRIISDKHNDPLTGIIITSSSDKVWKKYQVDYLIENDKTLKLIQINNLQVTTSSVPFPLLYIISSSRNPIKVELYNHYDIDHSEELAHKMYGILNSIVLSMERVVP